MLISARTYDAGKRVHYTAITARVLKFVSLFRQNGGRGSPAAIGAGYSRSSASVTSTKLLKTPRVLELIAAEIRRHPGDYASTRCAQRLLRESRPEWLRKRFRLALDKHAAVKVVGSAEHPALIADPGEEAMRDHIAKHGGELGLGADLRCLSTKNPEIPESQQCVSGAVHRLPDAADKK